LGGNETIGTLAGNGSGVVELSGGKLALNQNKNTAFAGVIQDSSAGATGSLQKDGSGTLTLSGASTYTGQTQINAGTVTLDGSLASQTVNVARGAGLTVNHGGLASNAVLGNAGTLTMGANDTVASFVNSGTVNGNGTLTAATYTLNDGSVINGSLGSGSLLTHGKVQLNGTSQAENVHIFSDSVLTLGGADRLSQQAAVLVDGEMVLGGGNQTIRTLNGGGTINVTAYKLNVTSGGVFTGTINASATNFVTDGGSLNLSQGTTTSQTSTVSNGSTLNVNNQGKLASTTTTVAKGGTLNVDSSANLGYQILNGAGVVNTASGSFDNVSGSTVKGFLTFSGDYVNHGTFAPGNSPGLITIAGNYTEAGLLQTELETTTPVLGHDQIRVGGKVTLQSGSVLDVQTYGGVLPTRGNVYQVIADLNGAAKRVNGRFGTVEFDADGVAGPGAAVKNAAAVFDVATGRVLATGLNGAGSSFADLGSSTSQRAAANALLQAATAPVGINQIDSDTVAGHLATEFITANGATASANAERFVPQYYGSIADYALYTGQSVGKLLLNRSLDTASAPAAADQNGSAFTGYLHGRFDTADQANVSRDDFYLGGEYRLGEGLAFGGVLTQSNGDLSANFGKGSAKGQSGTLYGRVMLTPAWQWLGSVGYTSYDYSLNRVTVVGNASGSTRAHAVNASLGTVYSAELGERFALMPYAFLNYGKASVGGFTEQGSDQSLILSGYDAVRTSAQLAASLVWKSAADALPWRLALDLGVESVLGDRKDPMNATLAAAQQVQFPITFASGRKTTGLVGVSGNVGLSKDLSLFGRYSYAGDNGDGQSLQLGVNYNF
ncbi:autotransporter domain-containing protein, partial [Neisseriaceae bacterium JH1-16]|nr:autotransporter domain-containing protein [Neisseriaceae bacterium JH1-16]